MPDVLERKKRRRKSAIVEAPPSAKKPKELFVATHRMASSRFLTTNISRAVIQNVWESEPRALQLDEDDFSEFVEAVLRQVSGHELNVDKSAANSQKQIRHSLTRRILKAMRNALLRIDAAELNASLDSWLSSLTKPSTERFIDQAHRLDKRGQTDAALDIIFDQIDEMLLAGEFPRVDQLLADTASNQLSVDLLLGVLTATLPAKERLANRPAFFASVEQTLRDRGQLKNGLLIGLE